MPNELPHRLVYPSPDARVARSPFGGGDTNFVNGSSEFTKRVHVPVVQWGAIRIRGRITGGDGTVQILFARPKIQLNPAFLPDTERSFIYPTDQPAVQTTFWTDGVEFSATITAAEHVGENWLRIQLNPSGGSGGPSQDIDFLDVSGVLLGLYH